MRVGDRVKLIHAQPGWDGVGRVVPDRAEHFYDDVVLVEWSNGATCYERLDGIEPA